MKADQAFEEQIALLLRALRSERFHFILIQHNHGRIREMVKERISQAYPTRKARSIRVAGYDYRSLVDTIYAQQNGFVYLDDFDYLLDHPEIYVAFNQRRDKLSQFPLTLIAFLPASAQGLKKAVRNIPDLWSLRNLTLQLEVEVEPLVRVRGLDVPDSQLGVDEQERRERELTRLHIKLEQLEPTPENVALIDNVYLQILDACEELGAYQQGYAYAGQYMEFASNQGYEQRQPLTFAEALNRRAKFTWHLGQYQVALAYLNSAIQIALQQKSESTQFRYMNDVALIHKAQGEYQKAREILESVLNTSSQDAAAAPLLSTIRTNLANVYSELGEKEKAAGLLRSALQADLAHFGAKHLRVAQDESDLGLVYKDLGKYEEAVGLFQSAINRVREWDDAHPALAIFQANLALVYLNIGKYEEAIDLLNFALNLARETLGAGHPHTLSTQKSLDDAQEKLRESETK